MIACVLSLILTAASSTIAAESFRFALLTDLHLSDYNPRPAEGLDAAVDCINSMDSVDFVLVMGDETDNGDRASMEEVKRRLDRLRVPYYITAGNHETKWSESGMTDFDRVFGGTRFSFEHKGVKFVGFLTGPIVRMGDGHVQTQDVAWVAEQLREAGRDKPVFLCTHYPMQEGDVDNWYELTDLARQYNVQAFLNGHYHRNALLNYDGIAGVVCRSNLKDKKGLTGFTLISVDDSIRVSEQPLLNGVKQPQIKWVTLPFNAQFAPLTSELSPRPSMEFNTEFPQVKEVWNRWLGAGVYGTAAVEKDRVVVPDDLGRVWCLDLKTGGTLWQQQLSDQRIISSPMAAGGRVVFGSTDGCIYCLSMRDGRELWRVKTDKAVLGSPLVANGVVYIGGSDGCMRALKLKNGKSLWTFSGVRGYVESRPCLYDGRLYFGSWGCFFYALNAADGTLAWRWTNGQKNTKFSPAAVWPVVAQGRVYFTAPDRYWTCLDAKTGGEVWRTKQHVVRETVGVMSDESLVFSREMNDSVVALDARSDEPRVVWKVDMGFGYDHDASMLVEKDGVVVFGTKNGRLYGIDARMGKMLWRHRLGNTIVHTVQALSGHDFVVTTMDGRVVKLNVEK